MQPWGASYCTDLKIDFESAFGVYSNGRHHPKDVSIDLQNLAYQIYQLGTILKQDQKWKSRYTPKNIIEKGSKNLAQGVKKFNETVVQGGWEGEEDLSNSRSTDIEEVDQYLDSDDE